MTSDTPEPVLTNEETNALLNAMRAGSGSNEDVSSLDLGSSDRGLRKELGRADRCVQAMTVGLRRLLLKTTGNGAAITPQPAEIVPQRVVQASVMDGIAIGVAQVGNKGVGLVTMGPSLVSMVLDYQFGAPIRLPEADTGTPDVRPSISSVEKNVLRPFMISVMKLLSSAWTGHEKALEFSRLVTKAEDLPDANPHDPMLRIAVRIGPVGYPADEIVVAFDTEAMSTFPKGPQEPPPPKPTPEIRSQVAGRVAVTEVDVIAWLGKADSSIRQLLSLAVGDVVRLHGIAETPIELHVEGTPVLLGKPMVHHGNFAVEVTHVRQPGNW